MAGSFRLHLGGDGGVMDRLDECGHANKTICQDCFDNVVAQLESQRDVEAKEVERLHAALAAKEEALQRLVGGIKHALSELGVPGPGYPAPVDEAVKQLNAALTEALSTWRSTWQITPPPAHDWKTCNCRECNQRKIDEDYYGPAREYRADADRGEEK